MRSRRFTTAPVAALSALALVLAACGDDSDSGDDPGTTVDAGTQASDPDTTDLTPGTAGDSAPSAGGALTVGSADFSESVLLAEIYAHALEDAGFTVDRNLNIGSREIYYRAIDTGEVDLVPEYTNSLLSFVLRQDDPSALPDATTIDEQVADLNEALPENLTVLAASTAEDKDVIVCTSEAATEHDLKTLSDLGAVASEIKLGAPPEFEDRAPFGLRGFQEIFAAEFAEFVPLQGAAIADALKAGEIDCGNIFSTLPVITTEGFVALEDDQNLVPHEAVLPLIAADAATPDVTEVLDGISAELTTDVLKELLVKVEVDKLSPEVVAEEYVAGLG